MKVDAGAMESWSRPAARQDRGNVGWGPLRGNQGGGPNPWRVTTGRRAGPRPTFHLTNTWYTCYNWYSMNLNIRGMDQSLMRAVKVSAAKEEMTGRNWVVRGLEKAVGLEGVNGRKEEVSGSEARVRDASGSIERQGREFDGGVHVPELRGHSVHSAIRSGGGGDADVEAGVGGLYVEAVGPQVLGRAALEAICRGEIPAKLVSREDLAETHPEGGESKEVGHDVGDRGCQVRGAGG